MTGTVQADVHVTGAGRDPHLSGYVDVQNGALPSPRPVRRFGGLTTRIELPPDRIRVPHFQILDNSGSPLTIQGDLAVHARQAGAVNVSLESKDFKLIDNQLGKIAVDTHLKSDRETCAARASKETVAFDAARLELDQGPAADVASPYSTEALPASRLGGDDHDQRQGRGRGDARRAGGRARARRAAGARRRMPRRRRRRRRQDCCPRWR